MCGVEGYREAVIYWCINPGSDLTRLASRAISVTLNAGIPWGGVGAAELEGGGEAGDAGADYNSVVWLVHGHLRRLPPRPQTATTRAKQLGHEDFDFDFSGDKVQMQ